MSDSWGAGDRLETPDPERQRKARALARFSRRMGIAETLLSVVAMVLFLASGLSEWLRDTVDVAWAVQAPSFVGATAAAYGAATFPLDFYRGFVVPRRYGLLTQGLRGWLRDRAKAAAVAVGLGVVLLEVLYASLHWFGSGWWLAVGAVYSAVFLALTVLAPVVLFPLFFKVRPLEDAALVERIERLAAAAGARVRGVYVWVQSEKGTAANAALMGLGRTRRVVLSDTLLDRYSPDEIEVILAHELGHHVHRDIPRGLAIQVATTFVAFGLAALVLNRGVDLLALQGITDVAAFPLLALALGVFGFATGPVVKAYSRHAEAEADRYALRTTHKAGDFISMMTKLTDQNLGEAEPSWWVKVLFYDHPTYRERVALARASGAPA